jgi:hypothetical protein
MNNFAAPVGTAPGAIPRVEPTNTLEEKMTANWKAIQDERKRYDLAEADEWGPARILKMLEGLRLKGTELESGLVLLEQPAPARAEVIALVSAAELFCWDDAQLTRIKRLRMGRVAGMTELFSSQVQIWQKRSENLAGPHAYLIVVDLDNWLHDAGNEDIAAMVELDTRAVRKFVCRENELAALLANPFGEPRATDRLPEFEVQRMDPHSFEPAPRDWASTVTHPFHRMDDTEAWLDLLKNYRERDRVTKLANRLIRRVMGRGYQLCEIRHEVLIERSGRCAPMPWFMLGLGEQYALAFCIYLALVSESASADMWLGLTSVVNHLDLSHYLLALDVLRDFVVATGASVYLKTNKENYQRLAKGKLELAVACRKAA